MSQNQPRLHFDENFGRPYIDALKAFVSVNPHEPTVEIYHHFEQFDEGEHDEVWIPAIAGQDVILVSADRHKRRGSRKKRGQPLPRLCVEYGIRHVLLTSGLARQKMFDKILAILSVWHDLLAIADKPRGVRFSLELISDGRGRLVEKQPPADIKPRPPKDHLF